jgi:hypothetical protein
MKSLAEWLATTDDDTAPVLCVYCHSMRVSEGRWQLTRGWPQAAGPWPFAQGICPICFHRVIEPRLSVLRGWTAGGGIAPAPAAQEEQEGAPS